MLALPVVGDPGRRGARAPGSLSAPGLAVAGAWEPDRCWCWPWAIWVFRSPRYLHDLSGEVTGVATVMLVGVAALAVVVGVSGGDRPRAGLERSRPSSFGRMSL